MKLVHRNFLVLALVVLTACSTLGVPTPQTFNERVAAGYVTVTSVRLGTGTLLNSGIISSADAQNVQNQANTARDGLDVARSIHETLPQAAEDKLSATLIILQTLQKYLESKKGAH